jgi:uncharacterized protein involved in outer membrane biogenesis
MSQRVHTMPRLVLLLGSMALITVLLAAALVRLPVIQRWTAARVQARLPPGITIERARIMLIPFGVRLENVSVTAGGPTLKSVSCRLRLPALLAGRLEIETLAIAGADLVVTRDDAGALHLDGALAPLLRAAAQAADQTPAARALAELPAVTASDAAITLIDDVGYGAPRTVRITRIGLQVGTMTPGGVPFSFSGRLEPAGQIGGHGTLRRPAVAAPPAIDAVLSSTGLDARTVVTWLGTALPASVGTAAVGVLDATATVSGGIDGQFAGDATLTQTSGSAMVDQIELAAPLRMSARFSASRDGWALSDGQLTVARLTAARITADGLVVAFAYSGRTLHLSDARATLYGGAWSQRGTVTMTDPPSFDLALRADDIGCAALLDAVTGERPDYGCERLSGEATVLGSWSAGGSLARGVNGSGRLELRGGTIPSSSILGAIWQTLVPLTHAGREPPIAAPTRVDRLTQSFALQTGRMHTSDLRLVTDDYTITGKGIVGLNGTLDLDTEVAMTAAGMTKLLLMASLPLAGEAARLPPIPTRISGTLGDPIVRPEIEDLPIATVKGLFRGAERAGRTLSGAAGSGLRALEEVW